MLCSPVKVHRRFEGTFRLNLHGKRVSQVQNQHGAGRYVSKEGVLTYYVITHSVSAEVLGYNLRLCTVCHVCTGIFLA
jgi:hypothetical protein